MTIAVHFALELEKVDDDNDLSTIDDDGIEVDD
jgi:hypothetical protein